LRPGRLAEGTICYTAFIGVEGRCFIFFAEFGIPRAWAFGVLVKNPDFSYLSRTGPRCVFFFAATQAVQHQSFPSSADMLPEAPLMIELTRLNGSRFVINNDLVQYAEAAPDTTLTLLNGEKVVVRESLEEMIQMALDYRARLIAEAAKLCPGGILFPTASALGTVPITMDDNDTARYASRRRAENL
jgi:flagellar protein FlbD